MPLNPLRIVKNWIRNTTTREENWDAIADEMTGFATRVNNNLKQLGLDINGSTYDFNNNGVATQSESIISRLTDLEAANLDVVGTKNLGLDMSTTSIVKLVSADGSNLSSTNIGYATFNSTSNAGRLITRSITSNLSITLTGAHWGFDTQGDLTDQPLWVLLLDTGSSVTLGVAARSERNSIAVADSDTAVGNITSIDKVLVSTALSAELNSLVFAKVLAAFDDTGNAGGENFWTLQTGTGDVEIGYHPITTGGEIFF